MGVALLSLILGFTLPAHIDNFPKALESRWSDFDGEMRRYGITFQTTVEVDAAYSYPHFYGDGPLIRYVNHMVQTDAEQLFRAFVDGEKRSTESHSPDFGGCSLEYCLIPVLRLPNLISIYGIESQSRACPHGWTHYRGMNFWATKSGITELIVSDLFLPDSGWVDFLLQYCDQYFANVHYGYYGMRDVPRPELKPKDLTRFVITHDGILITLPSYTVGGWADGPDCIVIPYLEIRKLLDPAGPLKEVPAVRRILEAGEAIH